MSFLIADSSRSESEAYKNFINSIDSEATKKCYKYGFFLFMNYCGLQDYDNMLSLPHLEDKIRDYITFLKVDRQLSSNSVNLYVAAIAHFYAMNNMVLNWRRLSKFKGKKRLRVEDKPYSKEQIQQLLDFADLRLKCIILLMSSAGLRRGAIPLLRVGDLERIDKYSLYKISVYKKESEAYFTFCTPECTKALDQYFDYRARLGEKISSESLVFRKEFNSLNVAKPRPLAVESISWLMNALLDKSGIRPRSETNRQRTSVMQCHGFRKYFETTSRLAGMDLLLINRCMGHSSGLEDSYLKLSDEQVLEGNDKMAGYISAIDDLTINEENRLKKKVQTLTLRIDRLEELQDQIDHLNQKLGL
jgi:integrase